MSFEMRNEIRVGTYEIIKEIMYPMSTASLNELSKSVVSGTGKRISQRSLTERDLYIIEFLHNFKVCSFEQIKRYLEIKGYLCNNISNPIFRLSKLYSVTNVIKYTYSNDVEKNKKIKTACLMGAGIHLISNYTNYCVDDDISSFGKLRRVTQKRLGYDLKFVLKTEPSIDIYLDLLELYADKIELFDFRMKLIDLTEAVPYIPTDLLISYKNKEEVNNLLVRGICDLEKDSIEFFVKLAKSFNALIEDSNYLNFYLPISDRKPRLLFVSNHQEILALLRKSLKDSKVALDYIDVLHYSETKEYFSNIFEEDVVSEDLNEYEEYDSELVRCQNV